MRSQLPAVPTLLASLLLTSLAGIAPCRLERRGYRDQIQPCGRPGYPERHAPLTNLQGTSQ
jgi:hypothetical protein